MAKWKPTRPAPIAPLPALAAALLLGGVLGFVGARVGGGEPAPELPEPTGSERDKTQLDLPIGHATERHLPGRILAGLTEPQKFSALKALGEAPCACGRPTGTYGTCLVAGTPCPNAAQAYLLAAELAREGKESSAIKQAIRDGQKPTPPPAPQLDPRAIYLVPLPLTPHGKPAQRGADDARVTIVEVSDFQCPFCSRVEPTLRELELKYGRDLRIVWGNNPLSFHPQAVPAAKAALAAGEQGKFWEMHGRLFAGQKELSPELYESAAKELGLDLPKFRAAFASDRFQPQIEAEQRLFTSLGASGTPAFFVNGRLLSGAQPVEAFSAVIDEELKRADAELAKGTAPEALYAALVAGGATGPRYAVTGSPGGPAPSGR